MARRRIWEISCFGLDAVLCTSFDADELLTVDAGFRSACEIPEHPGLMVPRSLLIYGIAHKACHFDNPTARHIENRLNAMHGPILEESLGADQVDVLVNCYAAAEEARGDLAGCLWAVMTDPRVDLRQQGLFWVQGLMIRSLLHWMRSWRACRSKQAEAGSREAESF